MRPPIADAGRLRAIRAAEARWLLGWLASGASEATLTQEAAASLARLEQRSARRD